MLGEERVSRMRRCHARVSTEWGLVVATALMVVLTLPFTAFAYDQSLPQPPLRTHGLWEDCTACHGADPVASAECYGCHVAGSGPSTTSWGGKGPHAGFTSSSNRCQACHVIHGANGAGRALLPEATIKATCETCHDGTGGRGVYGAIYARTGLQPKGGHRVETTRTIPGGDPATGGSKVGTFTGENFTLTCTDCHNPHDTDTVAAFTSDRRRIAYTPGREWWQVTNSTKLLRRRPSGATTSVAEYGSDWCAACHRGRTVGGLMDNHPVDLRADRADAFIYRQLNVIGSDSATSTEATGSVGGSNRGFLILDPRTSRQGTHGPICQQCHEDSREAGLMYGATADPTTFAPSLDGTVSTSSPRFQNFPHETVNQGLLVETYDNLCLNCHTQ